MPLPDEYPCLTLLLPAAAQAGFASLLQYGVLFPVCRPVAMVPFLLSLPGFTADYIEERVQTIFVDGVAADSLERELAAGSTLALSAAMPGLAGAIFRRQGLHSCLRSQPAEERRTPAAVAGFITLKLFNVIAVDRLPDLLGRGFLLSGKALYDFAVRRHHLFAPPTELFLSDRPVTNPEFLAALSKLPLVRIQGQPLPDQPSSGRAGGGIAAD